MKWPFFKKDKQIFLSQVNGEISLGNSFGKKALYVGKIPQSGGEFTHMWTEVIKKVVKKKYRFKNCLVLGVAGGTVITVLKKYYPKLSVTAVEIDPVILDVGQKYLHFKFDKKIKLNIADAFLWVKNDGKNYNLVVVDLYIADLNPPKSRQKSFLGDVKRLLQQGGIILFNCHYQKNKEEEFATFIKTAKKLFPHIEELFAFPKNKILLLSSNL